MAKDFIRVDQTTTTARCGSMLTQLANEVRVTRDLAAKIKGIMEHNINGSDYTDVESLFGVTTGNGQVAYNLVAGTLATLTGVTLSTDALTLMDRVG